jgi:uncharacterized membrane protein YkvA (DUF1232 family)
MRKLWRRIRFILNVRRFGPFLWEYFTSPAVPARAKLTSALLAAGYLLFPFDVIPDVFVTFGLFDDLAVLAFVLQRIVRTAPPHLRRKYGLPE